MPPTGATSNSSGFQVSAEFIAQLPRQLIVPKNHLQLFESVGEGEYMMERCPLLITSLRLRCTIRLNFLLVTLLLYISGTITDISLKQVPFQHYNTK